MPGDRCHRIRRAGSVYLHVLASSLLVTIIGLASLAAVRIQMHSVRLTRDYAEARACAVSAIELGLLYVAQDPNWRTTRPNGIWVQNETLGAGQFTLQGIDPQDNVLSDSLAEPLVLTGIGTKGIARHKVQVTLMPVIESLAALNTCLHASGTIQINAGKRITAVGAPISTNGQLNNDGVLDGDAEAQTVDHISTITGTLTVPAPAKRMPGAAVIAQYITKATAVPYVAIIDKAVLAPGCNPWGPTDPNGLYYINTSGADLIIKNSRVYGTLIIKTGSGTLTLDGTMFIQNYRSDFPAVLVDGNVIVKYQSSDFTLSEAANAANYNPVGAPYEGVTDEDLLDQYPSEIRGLVHIQGTLSLQQSARIVGVVICDGPVYGDDVNTIIHNAGLYTSPPDGYTYIDGMQISPHSWKQVVD
jgi:hypothetical protein